MDWWLLASIAGCVFVGVVLDAEVDDHPGALEVSSGPAEDRLRGRGPAPLRGAPGDRLPVRDPLGGTALTGLGVLMFGWFGYLGIRILWQLYGPGRNEGKAEYLPEHD